VLGARRLVFFDFNVKVEALQFRFRRSLTAGRFSPDWNACRNALAAVHL
jgi:hypothetical protein